MPFPTTATIWHHLRTKAPLGFRQVILRPQEPKPEGCFGKAGLSPSVATDPEQLSPPVNSALALLGCLLATSPICLKMAGAMPTHAPVTDPTLDPKRSGELAVAPLHLNPQNKTEQCYLLTVEIY